MISVAVLLIAHTARGGGTSAVRRFMQDAADSATSTALVVYYSFPITPSSLPKFNGLFSYMHAGRFIGNTIVN
jgi:hypothetical protein